MRGASEERPNVRTIDVRHTTSMLNAICVHTSRRNAANTSPISGSVHCSCSCSACSSPLFSSELCTAQSHRRRHGYGPRACRDSPCAPGSRTPRCATCAEFVILLPLPGAGPITQALSLAPSSTNLPALMPWYMPSLERLPRRCPRPCTH